MNMGFWGDGAATLDEAGAALARLLGRTAELGPGDRVLDAGCGCGDQDALWASEHRTEHILAIDNDAERIEHARIRWLAAGSAITFQRLSATELTVADGSIDKVLSLESAHGFDTRAKFFSEAFRVLRPGGVLAMTDILLLPGMEARHFAILPENMHSGQVMRTEMGQAGFEVVSMLSIREQVIAPFHVHLARLPLSKGLLGRIRAHQRNRLAAKLDYVIAKGRKPSR